MKTMNYTYTTTILLISLASIAALLSTGYIVGGGGISSTTAFAQETFPPPIFYQLRNIPSYAITIPFSDLSESPFTPSYVSIPSGMTVVMV
jgi:hypothetical protein